MARSPPPGLPGADADADPWLLPRGWGWAGRAHAADSASPASSSDSSGSCPCDAARPARAPPPPPQPQPPPPPQPSLPASRAPGVPASRARAAVPASRARAAPTGGQRQSASEREKLRMRTLARALHELRRFLPPSVAPAGQSLTKIETLRLAIRYIGHLSAVLGLGEDGPPRRRRRLPRGCPLCPDGPGPASWGAPPAGPWATPPSLDPQADAAARTPPSQVVPWTPPPACPGPRAASPGLQSQAVPWTPPPAPPEPALRYQGMSVCPESCLSPETPPLLPRSACQRLQAQPQWGCWGHSAEVLLSSGDQGPGPAFPPGDHSPPQSSGLQLSGSPQLWPEDLEGTHLGLFY